MRKYLAILPAVIFCTGLFAQNRYTDSSATCVAYWRKNDSRSYSFTKTKEKRFADSSTTDGYSFDVTIRVLDSTASGYKLEWKQGNFRMEGKAGQYNAATNLVMSGLKFIYTTDDVGTFKELVNWKEVRDFYVNMLKMQLNTQKSDAELKAIMDKVMASLTTKESVETIMIKDVQLMHNPYGVEYEQKGMDAETELPNVLGGNPFPAVLNLRLAAVEPLKDRAVISIDQEVDKVKGREALLGMLRQIAPKSATADLGEVIKKVEISDRTSFAFSLSSGWVSSIDYTRTVDVGGGTQVERFVVTEKAK